MSGAVNVALAVVLMVASGIGDAIGFTRASRGWNGDSVVWAEMGRAGLAFAIGISSYLVAIRPLRALGVESSAAQTLLWFLVTVVGVAALDGSVRSWDPVSKVTAVVAVVSVGLLVVRVAE